jgi:membrane protein
MRSARVLMDFLQEVLAKWNADHGSSRGAALAYFTLFSLAPLVMLTIAVVGLVLGPAAAQGEIVGRIQATVGSEVARTLESMLSHLASRASGILATAVSLVTMMVGASSAVGELQRSLDHIFDAPPVTGSGLRVALRRRLMAMLLILAVGLLLTASMLVSTALTAAHDAVMTRLPIVGPVLALLNFGVSMTLAVALFSAIFRVLPDATLGWRESLFGGVLTAALFLVGKSLLALYLGRAGVTSAYGAAGSLVLLLLWIYYSWIIVLVGAEVTAVYARRRGAAGSIAASLPRDVGQPDAR